MNKINRFILSILYFVPLYFFWIGVFPYILGNSIPGSNFIGAKSFAIGCLFPYIIAQIGEKKGYSWWKNFLLSGFLCTGIPFIGIVWLVALKVKKNESKEDDNFTKTS
jgi:hypothetical protein